MTLRLVVFTLGLAPLLFPSGAPSKGGEHQQVPARQFEFTYKVSVPALPPGSSPLRLWIPLPPTDPYQEISGLRLESPIGYKIERESEYGNRFAYIDVPPERATSPAPHRVAIPDGDWHVGRDVGTFTPRRRREARQLTLYALGAVHRSPRGSQVNARTHKTPRGARAVKRRRVPS